MARGNKRNEVLLFKKGVNGYQPHRAGKPIRLSEPNHIRFDLREETLICFDRTSQTWGFNCDNLRPQFNLSTPGVASAVLSPTADELITLSISGELSWWQLSAKKLKRSVTAHNGPGKEIAISPAGDQIFTFGDDRGCKIWETVSGIEIATMTLPAVASSVEILIAI